VTFKNHSGTSCEQLCCAERDMLAVDKFLVSVLKINIVVF